MKKSGNYSKVLDMINILSPAEKDALIQEIMGKLGVIEDKKENTNPRGSHCDKLIAAISFSKPDCPHCSAKATLGFIIKKGNHKGAQRYMCKSCGKKFVSTTNTAFARSHKNAETWQKFIKMTLSQKSLTECAEECGVCVQTAFNWRHKILNVFAVNQNNTRMSGNVEVDEMLIPISYKGNHVKGTFGKRERKAGEDNGLPRKSYHRGSDNKSNSGKKKACVFCMVEDGNKRFFAAVPGVGFMTEPMLDATVAKHINKDKALVLADDYRVTKNYFEKNGYRYMILLSNTSDNPSAHKPEVRDGLHLQHVNAMHQHIRKFLRPYCGVSTKYLSNYISLFIWLKSVARTKQKKSANKVSVARAAAPDCYISGKELHSRPAVPRCA